MLLKVATLSLCVMLASIVAAIACMEFGLSSRYPVILFASGTIVGLCCVCAWLLSVAYRRNP